LPFSITTFNELTRSTATVVVIGIPVITFFKGERWNIGARACVKFILDAIATGRKSTVGATGITRLTAVTVFITIAFAGIVEGTIVTLLSRINSTVAAQWLFG